MVERSRDNMEYTTIQKTADKWGISKARVHLLCQEGRIPGAVYENKHWRVPVDAIKPDGLGPTGTLSALKKAKEWGVSSDTVVRLCELGHVPDAVHIGRFWYIPEDAVYPLEGYLPLPMQAEKWGIPRQFAWKLCTEGRVPGAKRIGRDWYVPTDAKKPANGLTGRKPGYTSPTKIAEKWGVSRVFVCAAAKEGRIPGAEFIDDKWHIPEDAVRPKRQYRRQKRKIEQFGFSQMMEEVAREEGRKALEENERLKKDETFVVPESTYRKCLAIIENMKKED